MLRCEPAHYSHFQDSRTYFQEQAALDALSSSTLHSALDGAQLTSMLAGSFAYEAGRYALGTAFRYMLSPTAVFTPFLNGMIAAGALAFEVGAFQGVQRLFQNSSLGSLPDDFLHYYISFSILKLVNHGNVSNNVLIRESSAAAAMLASHQLTYHLGVEEKPRGDLSEQLAQAFAMNLSFSLGMGIFHRGFANKLQFLHRSLQARNVQASTSLPRPLPLCKMANDVGFEGINQDTFSLLKERIDLKSFRFSHFENSTYYYRCSDQFIRDEDFMLLRKHRSEAPLLWIRNRKGEYDLRIDSENLHCLKSASLQRFGAAEEHLNAHQLSGNGYPFSNLCPGILKFSWNFSGKVVRVGFIFEAVEPWDATDVSLVLSQIRALSSSARVPRDLGFTDSGRFLSAEVARTELEFPNQLSPSAEDKPHLVRMQRPGHPDGDAVLYLKKVKPWNYWREQEGAMLKVSAMEVGDQTSYDLSLWQDGVRLGPEVFRPLRVYLPQGDETLSPEDFYLPLSPVHLAYINQTMSVHPRVLVRKPFNQVPASSMGVYFRVSRMLSEGNLSPVYEIEAWHNGHRVRAIPRVQFCSQDPRYQVRVGQFLEILNLEMLS